MSEYDVNDLRQRLLDMEAENLELRARAGELPEMPRNSEGLPFSGARMITARNRRGLTPGELAEDLHVTRQEVIGFETETIAPTMEQIGNMAMILHFMPGFFFADDYWLINPERISWRDGPCQ